MLRVEMSRILPLLLALTIAQVVISLALVPTTICQERCPDDGRDGRCPPVCPSCIPTGHAASPTWGAAWCAPDVRGETFLLGVAATPADPEPRDIFHVPKRLLA
jgi:hypothetical protein